MRRRVASNGDESGSGPIHLAGMETQLFLPVFEIVKHLAITRYEDGLPRLPGLIILRTEGPHWKCITKDPDTQMQLQVVASTIDDALVLTDCFLGADKAPWEPDRYAQGKKPPGKKTS
jgi:hypothetical protein